MNVYEKKASNDYALNSIEYLVTKKPDSSIKMKRFIIILATLALFAGVCAAISWNPYLGAILILLVVAFFKIMWTNTKYEYEYTILQGELTMDAIIGAKKRKTVTSFLIREAESIAPFNGTVPEGAKLIDASVHAKAPNTWCAVYKNADGEKCALLFAGYNKALDIMAYYNKAATSTERIKDSI